MSLVNYLYINIILYNIEVLLKISINKDIYYHKLLVVLI